MPTPPPPDGLHLSVFLISPPPPPDLRMAACASAGIRSTVRLATSVRHIRHGQGDLGFYCVGIGWRWSMLLYGGGRGEGGVGEWEWVRRTLSPPSPSGGRSWLKGAPCWCRCAWCWWFWPLASAGPHIPVCPGRSCMLFDGMLALAGVAVVDHARTARRQSTGSGSGLVPLRTRPRSWGKGEVRGLPAPPHPCQVSVGTSPRASGARGIYSGLSYAVLGSPFLLLCGCARSAIVGVGVAAVLAELLG